MDEPRTAGSNWCNSSKSVKSKVEHLDDGQNRSSLNIMSAGPEVGLVEVWRRRFLTSPTSANAVSEPETKDLDYVKWTTTRESLRSAGSRETSVIH